jgi:hypothetical protein
MAKIAGRSWGGRRPGAGAPRGNLNGLKHGRYSAHYRNLARLMAEIPDLRDGLISIGKRRRKQQRLADAGASELLTALLQRAGDIVLHPETNHVESNQDLLDFLHNAEVTLRRISRKHSREAAKVEASIKRDEAGGNGRR